MGASNQIILAHRSVDLDQDHDLIHKALYEGCPEPFCLSRSRLIRAILYQRSSGLLPNDAFEGILNTARNPATRARAFNLFQIQLPEDLACA